MKKVNVCLVLYWIKTNEEKMVTDVKKTLLFYKSLVLRILNISIDPRKNYTTSASMSVSMKKYYILIFYKTALIPCQSIEMIELQNKNKILYFDGHIMYLH